MTEELRWAARGLWLSLILVRLWNLNLYAGKWPPGQKWLATVLSLASFTTENTAIFPKYYPCHILLCSYSGFFFSHSMLTIFFSWWLASAETIFLLQFAVAGLVTGLGFIENYFLEKRDRQFWFIKSDLVLNGVQLQAALSCFGFVSCFAHCVCVLVCIQPYKFKSHPRAGESSSVSLLSQWSLYTYLSTLSRCDVLAAF